MSKNAQATSLRKCELKLLSKCTLGLSEYCALSLLSLKWLVGSARTTDPAKRAPEFIQNQTTAPILPNNINTQHIIVGSVVYCTQLATTRQPRLDSFVRAFLPNLAKELSSSCCNKYPAIVHCAFLQDGCLFLVSAHRSRFTKDRAIGGHSPPSLAHLSCSDLGSIFMGSAVSLRHQARLNVHNYINGWPVPYSISLQANPQHTHKSSLKMEDTNMCNSGSPNIQQTCE